MMTAIKRLQPLLFSIVAYAYAASIIPAYSAEDGNLEAIKADYLLNLITYIDWEPIKTDVEPLNVCINKLGTFSQSLLSKSVLSKQQGTPIRIVIIESPQPSLPECHLVYLVDHTRVDTLSHGLFKVGSSPTLSDADTAIHFYEYNGKVRMEIFPQRLKRQNVTLSSEVLKLARINNRQ